jgi:Protein of unknown function (DUF1553)/Protein of unknown function (DUF1549)/Concanavalin A-like lectin/glucanases superfamily/Planctomycete cytochrome C
MSRTVMLLILATMAGRAVAAGVSPQGRVDFDRDVRPILSENCFACHGPDANKRQAGLRLDAQEAAFKRLPSGHTAIVPGNLRASMLIRRVEMQSMPPASTGKRLTEGQIALLRRWVEQGARYLPHWAFIAPKRPPLPDVRDRSWPINPIDRFILARLEKEGLRPSPVADRRTLIRRLSLDLTGLPPTIGEVNAFLVDRKPGAYERLVDRLLASPHYGERMALQWLDLARYADTHGYHIDSQRDMWLWRDWVIDAFNRNMPFDEFTLDQLAGDLLPNATASQKIATGFNRNHPINFEGGAIPEEYQTAYIADRIDTTSTVWMSLTMRCAQCHDHKFDPITQREYYRFYAFFNNVPEQGLDGQKGNANPFLKVPSPEQQEQLAALDTKSSAVEQAMKERAAAAAADVAAWEATTAAGLEKAPTVAEGLVAQYALDETSGEQVRDSSGKQPAGTVQGKPSWSQGKVGGALELDGSTSVDAGTGFSFDRKEKVSYGAWVYPTSKEPMAVLSRMDDESAYRGWDLYLNDGKVYVHLIHEWETNAIRVNATNAIEVNQWHHLFVTYDGSSKARGVQIYVDGKPAEMETTHDTLSDTIQTSKPLRIGRRSPGAPFRGRIDEVRIYSRRLTRAEVAQIAGFDAIRPILATAASQRTAEQKETLTRYYLENADEPYQKLTAELADWRKKSTDLENAIPTTMVMGEMEKPRETFMLIRGQYDRKGEKVTAALPAALTLPGSGAVTAEKAPPTRLDLAKWLVDPRHPLTARVAVNHYWQMYFGTGIVRTAENFGTQGEPPSHPELLDWLATELIRTGWDVKAMQRLIVTSATYRQRAGASTYLLQRDPENRLLARGPRFRLPAELIRDQALAISGLLVPKIGGPSVRPYQPSGLWEEIAFGGSFSAQKYVQDHGEALYRRSMYTFWKRTCPPPALQTFDAPEREFCMVRRSVTNTPLQALVLMNDPTYVEASRKFAERILTEVAAVPKDRIRYAYRLALGRLPTDEELRVLMSLYNEQLAAFRKDAAGATKLLSVGESPRNEKLNLPELAAWTTVASVLLNLDETITKS